MTALTEHATCSPVPAAGARRRVAGPWLLLAALSSAAAMDAVNSTVLVLARGHMMGSTHATPDEIAWINIAYLAAKLTAFPVAAWLTPRVVPSRLLVAATLALLLSSFGCAVTTDLSSLIAWRVAQGVGGAFLVVTGQTLLFGIFPRCRQGMVQALFAFSTIMAPTTIAPALQGWAVDTLSWRWIFLANLPLGLVGLVGLVGLLARPDVPGYDRRQMPAGRFDWLGLALLGLAMTCIVFVLQEGSRYDWFGEPKIVEVIIVGALALALFVAWQICAQERGALIDLGIFRDQHFSFGFIVSFIAGCAMFGSAFLIPTFATGVLDLSPTYAGLLLLPSSSLVCIGLIAAGGLIQFKRLEPVKPIPLGILCFMTAMWMLSGSTSESGVPDMMPALLLRGFGLGLLFISLTLVTLLGLKGSLVAHGVGLFNIGRQMGGQIGIAFLRTYLDHQVALNRNVLSRYVAEGNTALVERREVLTQMLTGRGYNPDEAAYAAIAVIQRALQEQVATLSFNECFLAVALLFIAALPVLIATKALLTRLIPIPHGHEPAPADAARES